jgi:hypothetical protein
MSRVRTEQPLGRPRYFEYRLLEAQLIASSPEHVYSWFEQRSTWYEGSRAQPFTLHCLGDEQLEHSLHSRNNLLIDLALARHGTSQELLRLLFAKGRGSSQTLQHAELHAEGIIDQREIIRFAVLSNRACQDFPYFLFDCQGWSDKQESVRPFVETGQLEEMRALFSNPALSPDLLVSLYEKKAPFENLDEDRWLFLVQSTIRNERITKPSHELEFNDGFYIYTDEYEYNKPICAAWCLTKIAPTTERWAELLIKLLTPTPRPPISDKEFREMLSRWVGPIVEGADTETGGAEEAASPEVLDCFGSLRCLLAQQMGEIERLKKSKDPALRCAFYRAGNVSAGQLRHLYLREPKLLLDYAVDNLNIWADATSRNTLEELCRECDEREQKLHYAIVFGAKKRKFETEYPLWFQSREGIDAARQAEVEKFRELKKISHGVSELRQLAEAFRGSISVVFWVLLGVITAFNLLRWLLS